LSSEDNVAQLIEQIETLVQPILDDLGLELVDLEFQRESHGMVLRFYLDKEGGINLDDCAMASREISAILDVEETIEAAYTLEVSSPGIERPLKKQQDFERFAGQLAKIKTLVAIDPDERGQNRKTFVGILDGFEGQDVLMTLKEKRAVQIRIALDQIERANLEFEF
jgi:ribosome maturation factor RimP